MNEKSYLPDPETAPELFEGVLTRRVTAYLIDLVLMTILMVAILFVGFISGLLTFGLGWLTIPIAGPIALVAYYALTLGSEKRATYGMLAMDIVLTPTHGRPLNGATAFLHPLVFWVSIWFLAPVSLIVALVTPRRQMLHDYFLGTLMLRRSPMVRAQQAAAY